MDLLTFAALLASAVGLVGGICGIVSLIYQRKQTQLSQQLVKASQEQEQEYVDWSTKYEKVSDALTRIYPKVIFTGPSRGVNAVEVVFPDRALRGRIERYLCHRKGWWGRFEPAKLSREQVLNPILQELIEQVLEAIERFKAEHSDWARAVGLLPGGRTDS